MKAIISKKNKAQLCGNGNFCKCMNEFSSVSNRKGLRKQMFLNRKTLQRWTGIVYSNGDKKDIFLNLCPFCGGKVNEWALKEEREKPPQ